MKKLTSLLILGLAVTQFAYAQNLVSRDSTIRYNYAYGAGGNIIMDTVVETSNVVQQIDSMNGSYSDEIFGELAGNIQYSASVDITLGHIYEVTGSLSNFTKLKGGGSTFVSAAATGAGSAFIASTNPGNDMNLYFDVANSINFHLYGNLTFTESELGPGNVVALQKWDGASWQNTFTTFSLAGQQGDFNINGILTAGQYRMKSQIVVDAVNPQSTAGVYAYNLEVVPEPITMFAIAPAALLFARRKKKN